jgi:SAM-dependent methyltransferase
MAPASEDREFDELVGEAQAARVAGWDFSWLDGRATEERPSWGYSRMVADRMRNVSAALDVQTGGGEMLASLESLPPQMVATEPWAPNVPVAAARLRGRGVRLVASDSPDLPFRDAVFDLVICRHPVSTPWPAIARVLKAGGTVLSQQIGGDNLEELGELVRGPRPPGPRRGPGRERAGAEASGLEVIDVREESLRCVFYDIAAVVYFLRVVVWIVPGFSVDRYRSELRSLHHRIKERGPFVAHSHRFLIEARKARVE